MKMQKTIKSDVLAPKLSFVLCSIIKWCENLNFRITKDIDMILLIENRFEEFKK